MHMRRASLAILLLIALVAGFTVRTVVLDASRAEVAPEDAAGIETARDFYAEVNAVLGGGSTESLSALLSPIFADHDSESEATLTREELLDAFVAAGAARQQARLDVVSIEPAGANLIVNVQPVAGETIEVAGLTMRPRLPGAHFEVLRVHKGQIVDRWAPRDLWFEVRDFEGDPPAISSSIGVTTTLLRVGLAGSDEQTWRMEGFGIAFVESGSVLLQLIHEASWTAPTPLEPGAFATIPAGAQARIRSADGAPVSVVLYAVTRLMASYPARAAPEAANALPVGSQQVLWRGTRYWSGADMQHRPAMVVLPAGGELEFTLPEGTELLAGTNDPGIELVGPGAYFSIVGENEWAIEVEGFAGIDAGHAAWVEEGSGPVILRNTSSHAVTIFLIAAQQKP